MKQEYIYDLFDQMAERFQSQIAIAGAERCITYGELMERSNSIANFLIDSGASPGTLIAIFAENRVAFITAMLGILKAGCAFVPLDTSLPGKRLQIMIEEVKVEWFMVETRFAPTLGSLVTKRESCKIFTLDEGPGHQELSNSTAILDNECGYWNPAPPKLKVDPDSLCYIYFTSGSTGKPKGIAGRLKGIDHFIRWEIKTLGIGQGVKVSQLLPLAFDGSLRDIFLPLCSGGQVCVPKTSGSLLHARELIDWIETEQVQVIHCVPSLFRMMVNEVLNPKYFSALRYILMAGEPLLSSDVARWVDIYQDRVQLINLYGTSETTMAKFYYCVKTTDKDRRTIPIGKPIEGAQALILNQNGKPCAPGVAGEIYIRTPYRSLGYYNNPELTKEVFIPNPFSQEPDDIVYKTGDLGRILEDGNFEYLGRKDHQVKIRGMRVELTEVENLLRGHEKIKDVAVIDSEDGSGYNFLAAYLVLNGSLEVEEIRNYIADELPSYMIPAAFIFLDDLPKTLSGKVDRQALPSITQANTRLRKEYVAPRTPVEGNLAEIWKSLLGIEAVGIYDNFFHIGGHSLLATQMLSRVREALHVELPLRNLFESPTIAGLALAIIQIQVEQEDEEYMTEIIEELRNLPESALEAMVNGTQGKSANEEKNEHVYPNYPE